MSKIYKGNRKTKNYITIDGGTTNTRISLVRNKEVVDTIKLNIGVKVSRENKSLYENEIKSVITKILFKNKLDEKDIIRILASGMITSEFGLCYLEHTTVPAGICELHGTMKETELKNISEIPFVFIRGVKTSGNTFENIDLMRGEETELMGIIESDYKEAIYILPGSHSKIIKLDSDGRIIDFSTMLTGEMIYALSESTILKDAVDLKLSSIDDTYLEKGYDYTEKVGINKAIFKVRILKNSLNCSEEETYSFYLGVILFNEINEILKDEAKTVILGGKSQIKNAIEKLLSLKSDKEIISLNEKTVENSTPLGLIKIYEYTKKKGG